MYLFINFFLIDQKTICGAGWVFRKPARGGWGEYEKKKKCASCGLGGFLNVMRVSGVNFVISALLRYQPKYHCPKTQVYVFFKIWCMKPIMAILKDIFIS